MRTTVDLPPAVHSRVVAISRDRHQSLSTTVAELTVRGLHQMDEPVVLSEDPVSGLPVLSLGKYVTSEEVAETLDDE
jgi:hypothetical protein